MNPWVRRGIVTTALASSATLGGYLLLRSARTKPAPTLEDLIELTDLPTIHPGGQGMTKRLVEACGIAPDMEVLNVQCGTGESAILLAESYGVMVTGADLSEEMVEAARGKAAAAGLETRLTFLVADAYELPFKKESFDAVIAEFTASSFDKDLAAAEWARVLKEGGCLGIHDVVWLREPFNEVREHAVIELGFDPATVTEWIEILREAGLTGITAIDMTESWAGYSASLAGELGAGGVLRTAGRLANTYGVNSVRVIPTILKTQIMTRLSVLGYAIVVGRKT